MFKVVRLGYAVALGASFLCAVIVAVGAASSARHLIGATLTPDRAPTVSHVFWLVSVNLPACAWPLFLPRLVDAHRDGIARRVADSLVVTFFLLNTAQVGAALGAYGAPLLPYLPQVPLEWGGLALGAGGWFCQRRRLIGRKELLATLTVLAVFVIAAALLETFAVPHG
ncbi:MAG TPA: hypothetical protein VN618_09465 [Solirubrobacteraceae bacterium]|nr:hypothetical protein [Solirubrobacteraceae bacterium]